MSFSKLKQLHVIIIGSFLCVAAAVAMFFFAVKPQQVALTVAQKRCDDARPVGNDAGNNASIRQAEQALNAAFANAALVQENYQRQMRLRMPDLDFQDRELGMLQWWREASQGLTPLISAFAKDPGLATVQTGFQPPQMVWNPNDPLFDQDVIVVPLGQVSGMGNFKGLMNNIRRWNNCKRLVMIDGAPSLTGSSPNLVVTYAVKCIIFPVAKGGKTIDMAGAPGGAAGGAPGVPMAPPPQAGPPMQPPPSGAPR